MFTGLVQYIGQVKYWQAGELQISCADYISTRPKLGDSIAVNGICLTITELGADWFSAYAAPETCECTNINNLELGEPVNLESCLTLQTPLGGHIVSGHIDGVAYCTQIERDQDSTRMEFKTKTALMPFIAKKGSVALNGVSLTVTSVTDETFSVMLIPHTLEHTNLSQVKIDSALNLEVDLIARYAARMMHFDSGSNL